MSNPQIAAYIAGLSYDPRVLLSVEADGSTASLPVKDRQGVDNGVIICTKITHKLTKNLDEVAILSPTAGAIFPGALVAADQALMEGRPTPIGLPRAPAMLSIDLPGLGDASAAVVPTNSAVQAFRNTKLEQWSTLPVSQGYKNAARSILQVTKSYSSQQVALDLGFNAKWASGSASAQLGVASTTEKSVLVAYFKQVFYTITMDTPTSPDSVFADTVSLGQAQEVFSSQHPPAYVRSVDYGRILLVKMETSAVDTSVNLKAAFDYATGDTSVGGSVNATYKNIIKNSTFQVVAIGGGAEDSVQMFDGSSDEALKGLRDYIAKGAGYRRDNPGLPVAYTVVFLKDNQFARMGSTAEYTETECVRYNNGFVRFAHDGWYVAKFSVNWTEPDAAGNYTVPKAWASGEQTKGYTASVSLPGDARNVQLYAEAATGLVWSPWGEIFKLTLAGPDNKTYHATGTTLDRSFNVTNG